MKKISMDMLLQMNSKTGKRMDKNFAWADLVLLASSADSVVRVDKQIVTLSKGDVVVYPAQLAKRWGWSERAVRSFLNEVEKTGEALFFSRKTFNTANCMGVHICNYSAWCVDGCVTVPLHPSCPDMIVHFIRSVEIA